MSATTSTAKVLEQPGGELPSADEARRSARDRSAHRTYPVTATPGDVAFVRYFVLAFVGLVLAAAAVNVVADPLGYFGTGLVPRATWDDRDEKAQLFLAQALHPGLLVIGSSRTMKLDPACAQRVTGLSAFNFGVSGGRPEDFVAIERFVEDHAGPSVKRILMGVEPDILLDDVPVGTFARQSRYLGGYVRADRPPPEEIAAALFGQSATILSVQSLLRARHGAAAPPRAATLRADGLLSYPQDEAAVDRGTYDQSGRIAAQLPGLRQAFADAHHISPERVAMLRRLLARVRARGVRVDAFIPPTHPSAAEALRATGYPARLRETQRLLQTLAQEGLIVYHETISGERIGITPDGYFDAYHLMQPNADRLLGVILGNGTGCAVQ